MRAWWMGVGLAVLVVGCRTSDREGQAVGVERTKSPTATEQAAPGAGKEKASEQIQTARLLGAIQLLSQAEIDWSKMALQKSSSSEVKAFATLMIPDHQQDIDTIGQIAQRQNLDVKGAMATDPLLRAQQEAYRQRSDQLRGLSGEAFDATFMPSQPEEHVHLAQLAKQSAAISSDAGVDALSAQVERHAEHHRAAALRALPVACGGAVAEYPAASKTTTSITVGAAGAAVRCWAASRARCARLMGAALSRASTRQTIAAITNH